MRWSVNSLQSLELGRDVGGNGNLMLLEVVAFHVSDSVMDGDKCRPWQDGPGGSHGVLALHAEQRIASKRHSRIRPSIGLDQLPEHIRTSEILTGK